MSITLSRLVPTACCAYLQLCACRPDGQYSRPFGSLSGGQQALATLALSFALQAAFPSPFYFFDEIDCALDTSNATRVADYIAAQKSAQYLVVSHKPQVMPQILVTLCMQCHPGKIDVWFVIYHCCMVYHEPIGWPSFDQQQCGPNSSGCMTCTDDCTVSLYSCTAHFRNHVLQVYERASCLVGVYTQQSSSRAVTIQT